MSDAFYQVAGCIAFAAMIAAVIVANRVFARLRNRAMARAMAPLAAAIAGHIDARDPDDTPAIVAQLQGRALRAYPAPKTSAGYGESALTINAFHVLIADVSGNAAWTARFHVTGMLGQGARQLQLEIANHTLGERLVDAGLLDVLQVYCAGTADYAAATYDARARMITVTDDVLPKVLPTAEHFRRHAQLALQVAQLNEVHNSQAAR